MGLKGVVMELMRTADEHGLQRLIGQDRRAVRFVIGRLWDPDEAIRERAAVALGEVACVHPDLGLDMARRLMWALNDESATNGVHGLAALAEIGYRNPRLIAPFVGPMSSLAWDDGIRLDLLRALARIAEGSNGLVRPYVALLEENVDRQQPQERTLLEKIVELEGLGDT